MICLEDPILSETAVEHAGRDTETPARRHLKTDGGRWQMCRELSQLRIKLRSLHSALKAADG